MYSPAMQVELGDISMVLQQNTFAFELTSWPDTDFRFIVSGYHKPGMTTLKHELAKFRESAYFIDFMYIQNRRAHAAKLVEVTNAVACAT
jgi:hypothetical protein